jgi:hypothetical protein
MYYCWSLAHRRSSRARPASGTPQDVLDVDGLTAKRYLDIAVPLKKRTAVINDNEATKPRRKAGLTPTSGLDHGFSAAATRNISIACGRSVDPHESRSYTQECDSRLLQITLLWAACGFDCVLRRAPRSAALGAA